MTTLYVCASWMLIVNNLLWLNNELPEESNQFRFLRVVCFANLKGTVGLIMSKESVM